MDEAKAKNVIEMLPEEMQENGALLLSQAIIAAEEMQVASPDDVVNAVEFVGKLKAAEALIEGVVEPEIKEAYTRHKKLTKEKRELLEPVVGAATTLRDRVGEYLLESGVEVKAPGLSVRRDKDVYVEDEEAIIKQVMKGKLPATCIKVDTKKVADLVKAGMSVPGVVVSDKVTPIIKKAEWEV